MEEDEFKSKLQQSEGFINHTKKQLEAKDEVLRSKNEKLEQLQTKIDGQTKMLEANNRTVQELRERQTQLQGTIDGLTKTVETLNQKVQLLCEHPQDVSTCRVETVSTSEWTEISPAINTANFRPNNVVW